MMMARMMIQGIWIFVMRRDLRRILQATRKLSRRSIIISMMIIVAVSFITTPAALVSLLLAATEATHDDDGEMLCALLLTFCYCLSKKQSMLQYVGQSVGE
jgi:hypothetical protein